jgi:hypothetical protein
MPLRVSAVEIIDRETLKLDENYFDADKVSQFSAPLSILLIPIDVPTQGWSVGGEEWYKGIYYFLTGRQGLGDVPFHFLSTSDGVLMQGAKFGVEQNISIVDGPSNPIVIGYLNDTQLNDFERGALSGIKEKVLELMNTHAVSADKVSVSKIQFSKQSNSFAARAVDAGGRYGLTLSDIQKELASKYNPIKREYSFSIQDVGVPTQEVKPGNEVIVPISISNESSFSLAKGASQEFFVSKVGEGSSLFFLDGVWVSPTQIEVMKQGEYLRAGETGTYEIKLNIPLYFGVQSEEFQLIDSNGNVYPNTNFKIELTVGRVDGNVVEILDTETGALNVRDKPSGFSNVINSVLPGQRFIELDRTNQGWVQIQLSQSESGWVSAQYVKRI